MNLKSVMDICFQVRMTSDATLRFLASDFSESKRMLSELSCVLVHNRAKNHKVTTVILPIFCFYIFCSFCFTKSFCIYSAGVSV